MRSEASANCTRSVSDFPGSPSRGSSGSGKAAWRWERRTPANLRLTRLSQEEVQKFRDWNRAYREKFGFPFIICARLNKKEAILAAFPRRLTQDRSTEITTALEEIAKIAKLRLEDAVT